LSRRPWTKFGCKRSASLTLSVTNVTVWSRFSGPTALRAAKAKAGPVLDPDPVRSLPNVLDPEASDEVGPESVRGQAANRAFG